MYVFGGTSCYGDFIFLRFHSGFMLPSQLTPLVHIQTAITSWKDSPVQIFSIHLPHDALECVHLCDDRKHFCPGCTGNFVLVLRLEIKTLVYVHLSYMHASYAPDFQVLRFVWCRVRG